MGDIIALDGEVIPEGGEYEMFDPNATWKRKILTNYYVKDLREKIFDKGKRVYNLPDVETIRDYCSKQIDTLWDEIKRFENPEIYHVDLSQGLYDTKQKLIDQLHEGI